MTSIVFGQRKIPLQIRHFFILIPKDKSKNKFCAYVTLSKKKAREDIRNIVLAKFDQTCRNTDSS